MSAPGLRLTESEISSTRLCALAASTALPMRASLNIETTARLDSLQMEAASWISSCIDVGPRPRRGNAGRGGSSMTMAGMSSSWANSESICRSASSRETDITPAATSSPLEVSIHTSSIAVAWMRSRSLGSFRTNFARQNGCSIQEPQNSCRYMPRMRFLVLIRLSMTTIQNAN